MSLLGKKKRGTGGCAVDQADGNELELLYGRGGQPSRAILGEIIIFGERNEDLGCRVQLFGISGIYSQACPCKPRPARPRSPGLVPQPALALPLLSIQQRKLIINSLVLWHSTCRPLVMPAQP